MKTLELYKTYKNKNYISARKILAQAEVVGIKIEAPYCESFNVISIVV